MKLFKQLIFIVLTTAILYLLEFNPASNLMSTLYTVSGIFFSIGLSLIITFDLNPIKNTNYLASIRKNLSGLRDTYIKCFSASTFVYLLFLYAESISIPNIKYVNLAAIILNSTLSMQLFIILFFIVNFTEIQRFKDEISDRVREETD